MNHFKADLPNMSTSVIVRKHITFGDCYILSDGEYFALKSEVADEFDLHPSEVLIVGSGKLGFSIADNKRYLPFRDESDIDVAVVSSLLFDEVWRHVFEFSHNVGYWPEEEAFKRYLFRGWIRPDKLPRSQQFEFRNRWWEFFRSLTSSGTYGQYRIHGGLYKSWYYLEQYQTINVRKCQQELRMSE
jgi:hypothetical protein